MFRSTTKIYSLLESLPEDAINEIISHLEYKHLTKLRVNKYMNAIIEGTPAGKKAREANILIQQVDDAKLLKRIIKPTIISSIHYLVVASSIASSLLEEKIIPPNNNPSMMMKYVAFDTVMSAIFAASIVRLHCGYHHRNGYATATSMLLGALTVFGGAQGGIIGYKATKFIADIAHLPKEFQYAGAWLGLAVGVIAAANTGILAMKGPHVFSLFHNQHDRYRRLNQAYEIRNTLAPKNSQG